MAVYQCVRVKHIDIDKNLIEDAFVCVRDMNIVLYKTYDCMCVYNKITHTRALFLTSSVCLQK